MRIAFIGDVHGSQEAFLHCYCKKFDYAIQVGDLAVYIEPPTPTFFVYGNHEDPQVIARYRKGEQVVPNLYLLNNRKPLSIEGLTILGIGGVYAPQKAYYKKRSQLTEEENAKYFNYGDIQEALRVGKVDILVSHEVPAGFGIGKGGKDYGVSPIRELIEELKPKLCVCGHIHQFNLKEFNSTKILTLDRAHQGMVVWEDDQLTQYVWL